MIKHFFVKISAVIFLGSLCAVCACTVVDKHEHDYSTEIIAPTCTQGGHTHYECSCGDNYDGDETEAFGHDIIPHAAQAPTCETSGWEAYETCSRCDYTTYKEIPALGHDIREHAGQAATCTAIGWAAYEDCSRCGYTTYEELPAFGHDIREYNGQTATCTEIGWETYEECVRCDYTTYREIPALGHDLTHHEAKTPTCLEHGWAAYDVCSHCDFNSYEEISALGHSLEHIEAKESTCTESGWEAYERCTRCDYTTYKEIPAKGHDLTHYEAKQPTCLEHGWAAYDVCSRCNFNSNEELSALGHDFTEYAVDDIGHSRYCKRCDLHEEGEHVWKNNACTVCKFAVDYSAGLNYEEISEDGQAVAYSVAGRGKATDAHIIIPAVYNNAPVTAISDRAFYGNQAVIGVTVPESIAAFGESCFAGCSALQKINYNAVGAVFAEDNTVFSDSGNADIGITVHIGDKVPVIPAYIFNGVANVRKVVFAADSICSGVERYAFAGCNLRDFTVPACMVSFGEGAFKDNSALNGVYYGGNLEKWLEITFADGDSNPLKYGHNLYIDNALLNNLVIPERVTAIKNYAFIGCSIQSLTLGEQITSIGASAFDSCRNMLEINYNAVSCASLKSTDYAFQLAGTDADGITVNIGEKVTVIPAYLFSGSPDSSLSSNITRVKLLDDGVCKSIEWRAFAYCHNLEEVELATIESVGSGAFIGCVNLKTVRAGAFLTLIKQQAFMDCVRLVNLYYDGTTEEWKRVQKEASLFFRVESCTVICNDGEVPAEDVT